MGAARPLAGRARRLVEPARRRLRAAGGFEVAAEAGLDAGRPVRRARARRGQPRPGRDPLRAQAGRAGRDRRARALLRGAAAVPRRVASSAVQLSPALAATGTYPFVRLERGEAAPRRPRASSSSTSARATRREPTDPLIRQALVDALDGAHGLPARGGAAGAARGDRRAGCGRRFGVELDPEREVDPDARLEGGDLQARAARRRPGERAATSSLYTEPALPGLRARRAVRRRRARAGAAARGERLPARPRRARPARAASAPRSSGSTTRTTRPARSRRSSSTSGWPSSRAEHDFLLASDEAYTRALVRRAAALGARRSPTARTSPSSTRSRKRSSMTGYRSGFVAGPTRARRRAARVPADRRHGAAGVRPARVDRRVGRRGARRARRARATGASASSCSASLEAQGLRVAGERRRRCTSGSRCRRRASEAFAERLLEHGVVVVAGRVLRRRRRGLRPARARPDASRSASARPRSSRRCCDAERVEEIVAALDRGERRVADEASTASGSSTTEAKEAILEYFRLRRDGADRGRAVRVPRQDPAQARLRGARRAGRAAGGRALRLVPLAGRRADAELREHRRLGRAAARWSTRGRPSARARRSARTSTSPAASGSAACSSRRGARPVMSRTARSSARARIVVEGVVVGERRRDRAERRRSPPRSRSST